MLGDIRNFLLLMLMIVFSGQSFAVLSAKELIAQLRADHQLLQQARTELEITKSKNKTVATESADLENWVRTLTKQMAEDCRDLAALSTIGIPADLPCDDLIFNSPTTVNIDQTAEFTQRQKTQNLEDQLNGSISEFDESLLREQDRIKARAPRTDSAAASGSGASGGESAGSSGSAANKTGGDSKSSQKGKQDSAKEDGSERTSSNEKGTPTSSSTQKSSAPKDIADGSDDDVIARQIREAAEKESDPELKKKLWDEYRRYRDAIK